MCRRSWRSKRGKAPNLIKRLSGAVSLSSCINCSCYDLTVERLSITAYYSLGLCAFTHLWLLPRFRTIPGAPHYEPSTSSHTPATATMASYMTGSEAFNRENHVPSGSSGTPQSAWSNKYRGVSPRPIDQSRSSRLTTNFRRQRSRISTLLRPCQSHQTTQSPPLS